MINQTFSQITTRTDWGFGNPNKTGALIAMLMVSVWVISFRFQRGFWIALGLFGGLGMSLDFTQSRGSFIGVFIGCLVFVANLENWSKVRAACLGGAIVTVLGFGMINGTGSRFATALHGDDLSIANRLLIWKNFPAMVRDAPNGWGLGRSGNAYMQWYQPLDRKQGYRTLVSSHLTWLAELGWPGRICYIFGWAYIFLVVWPIEGDWKSTTAFAVWTTFCACSLFSSIAESPVLWIIPGLSLIAIVIKRLNERAWPNADRWLFASAIASVAVLCLWGMCTSWPKTTPAIRCLKPGLIVVGNGTPQWWLVNPDQITLGEHYGHTLRQDLPGLNHQGWGTIGVADHARNVPTNQAVILSGPTKLPATYQPSKLVWISPQPSDFQAISDLSRSVRVVLLVGEFSYSKHELLTLSKKCPNSNIRVAKGEAGFIGDWLNWIAQ